MNYITPFFLLIINLTSLHATSKDTPENKKKDIVKQKIQCNMTIKYKKRPKHVDAFSELFSEGILYGRLRTNSFLFTGTQKESEPIAVGVGGSLIFKSARYQGFSFTSGVYTSQNINNISKNRVSDYAAGKDTFSRYVVAREGRDGLTAVAQNYLSYKSNLSELKVGHFLMESSLLKSNDTKMIPNAFEGVNLRIDTIPKTQIQLAYITKQKLRDHEDFHRVLAYSDDDSTPYGKWRENDDGAMHKGLTTSKLNERGIDDKILLFETENRSLKNTTLKVGYTAVPDLLSSVILEGRYSIKMDSGLKVKPAIRYMKQFDDGAGEIGGANIKTDTTGYADPDSLSNTLIASRVDFIYGAASLRVGYSKVSAGGDIVSPWRAQPTAGYSRAMSRTNWYSDTETTMLRADFDFDKAGLVEGLRFMSRYAIQDFDDTKSGVPSDLDILTFDVVKRFRDYPNFIMKLRTAFVKEDHKVKNLDGSYKKDPTYNDIRLEMNYLF